MLIALNYNSVTKDFDWVIRILNSVETESQMKVVSKCFELWEAKHVDDALSLLEKNTINDLRKKYWALFRTKNAKFILTSHI